MKNKEDISDELIFKVLNKEASESENEIFQEWVDRSSRNKKIFLHLERLWLESNGIADYYKIDQEQAWGVIYKKMMPKAKHRILQPMIKVAAVIAIAYLLGALSMYFIHTKPQQRGVAVSKEIIVKAPLGSKTEVELSDGTKVWLNSGSEIRYPAIFDQNQRDIHLIGEAYFDVEKNGKTPFFVHTDDIDIKVLGTRFNVKSYTEEELVETTLEEGSISINKKGSDQILKLQPKEKAIFVKNIEKMPTKAAERFVVVEDIDTEIYTCWRNKKLVFKREKLSTLAIKMERWYNVQISVGNKKLADEMVTGKFENESVEQALQALQISMPFKYQINKNQITILPMD